MTDCIFCKIIAGDIPGKMVYQDDEMVAFHDVAPAAPVHVLVVPKRHCASMLELQDTGLFGRLMDKVVDIAKTLGLEKNGFRTVINTGQDGGQTVPHLHIHLLGGREMAWPPG